VQITLEPLHQKVLVDAGDSLLSAINKNKLNVPFLCGGKGLCATCHVFIAKGMELLSPRTPQESATLSAITGCTPESRLACQTLIHGDDIIVKVPEGMYVGSMAEIEALIGRRAGVSLLHPKTGEVLIEKGKLILRSTLNQLAKDKLALNPLYDPKGDF